MGGRRSPKRRPLRFGLFSNLPLFVAIVVSGLLQLSAVTLPFAQPVFEVATQFSSKWLLTAARPLAPLTIIGCVKLLRALVVSDHARAR
jgi:magnesium-transporting ATPase (P-type)